MSIYELLPLFYKVITYLHQHINTHTAFSCSEHLTTKKWKTSFSFNTSVLVVTLGLASGGCLATSRPMGVWQQIRHNRSRWPESAARLSISVSCQSIRSAWWETHLKGAVWVYVFKVGMSHLKGAECDVWVNRAAGGKGLCVCVCGWDADDGSITLLKGTIFKEKWQQEGSGFLFSKQVLSWTQFDLFGIKKIMWKYSMLMWTSDVIAHTVAQAFNYFVNKLTLKLQHICWA